ncbi:MAG TPA: hypothetical protein VHD34_05295 [Xanthobacteraceae bacterium]|nr:hypothetical protein [Xanthobacteraceae bacterium]
MAEGEADEGGKVRKFGSLAAYFSLFVAGLSLLTSLYQGYLNTKFVEIVQKNVSRGESMRTCKDIIDAYFQIKLRVSLLAANGPDAEKREVEAKNAVSHFAALGTYLANLQNEEARVRYTHLSWALEKAVKDARTTPVGEVDKLFVAPDDLFAGMNKDCVRVANSQL